MPWYRAGTVSVALNSNVVTGTGTAFIANVRAGDGFRGPDGNTYEVTNIASNTAISISPNYQGANASAGIYAIMPMQGYVKDSADALRAASLQIGSNFASKADIDSPVFTGIPRTPTPPASDSSTRLQTSAGSLAQMQAYGPGANQIPNWPSADLGSDPGLIPSGFYRITSTIVGLPAGWTAAVVLWESYGTNGGGGLQIIGRAPTAIAGMSATRAHSGTAWSDWVVSVSTAALQAIGLAIDTAPVAASVDNLRQGGVFQIASAVATASGLPIAVGYAILHLPGANGVAGHSQFASPITSVSGNRNRVFHRQLWNNAWSAWQEFAYVENLASIITAQMSVYGFNGAAGVQATDLDVIDTTGFRYYTSTATSAPLGRGGTVITQIYSAAYRTQSCISLQAGDASQYNRLFTRTYNSGTWGVWKESLSVSDILGTVSQSGGVPTGALMERGNNANGQFERYACGTLICRQNAQVGIGLTAGYGSAFYNATPWTFPVSFVGVAPFVSLSATATGRVTITAAASISLTNTAFNLMDFAGSNTGTYTLSWVAIGRWYA